jgi:CheY-like chemotaxis protein
MKTVLVVDDAPSALTIASKRLQAEGVRILTAANGAEGLRMAKEHRPDVVVLDLMMPGMHGYTLIQEIRNDPNLNHVRILVTSAKTYTSDIERTRRLGADRYLSKPYDLQASGIPSLNFWGKPDRLLLFVSGARAVRLRRQDKRRINMAATPPAPRCAAANSC